MSDLEKWLQRQQERLQRAIANDDGSEADDWPEEPEDETENR